MALLIALLGLIAGTLIGTVGIGGVLIVPILYSVLDYDLQVAIASASFSFLFVGVAGTISYARRGTISWGIARAIWIGIVPGALLGAWLNAQLPDAVLIVLVAALLLLSGGYSLAGPRRAGSTSLSIAALIGLGAGVGVGSALTGSGGPVILVPTLLLLGVGALTAVGVSQPAQIPIALFATIGYLAFGEIDLNLGLLLGFSQAVGVLVGARIAHALPAIALGRLVAFAALIVGGVLLVGVLS